ncbi:MAG TPA: LuxR C-terminal-related transcriptional regulator [Chloroflexia bacterium]|nr:LuxR C-terminal-related transcriptional regulator [Chloroflexia bacterium]
MHIHELDQLGWFAQTKFICPRVTSDLVERPYLVESLYHSLITHRLTLVSAPAGSGKTTLLAGLPQVYPDLPLCWVGLDSQDNDPIQFLSALIVALSGLNPTIGEKTGTLLKNLPRAVKENSYLVGTLVNAIMQAQPEPFGLVLDDLHWVTEPRVYHILNYLLERLPPQMHLIVASRYDPPLRLARLRARGEIAEFRLQELRFTQDEAALFLNRHLQRELPLVDLADLQLRTEGWAAALRLLANSLDRFTTDGDREAFIRELNQTDRYIFDYLAEEVLNHQSPDVRAFLLETSILHELNPEVCEAVTGRNDAAAMLADLYRRNLFIVAVDGQAGKTYRYHDLFAQFLQAQLSQQTPVSAIQMLHKCAAEAQATSTQAISHYLAGELWEEAAVTIEQVARPLIQKGLSGTVKGWIVALPETALGKHPWLNYYLGICAHQREELREAYRYLQKARTGFEAMGNEAGLDETLVQLADCLVGQGELGAGYSLITQGLTRPLQPHSRVQLLCARMWLLIVQGEWSQAGADLEEALKVALSSDDPDVYNILALQLRAPMALLPRGVELLENYCEEVLKKLNRQAELTQAGTLSLLSCLQLWRGYFATASRTVEQVRKIIQPLGEVVVLNVEMDAVWSLQLMQRGDYLSLEEYLAERLPQLEGIPAVGHWYIMLLYLLGRAYCLNQQPDKARAVYARMTGLPHLQELPVTKIACGLMQASLKIMEQDYRGAETLLYPLLAIEEQVRLSTMFGHARLLLAQLYLLLKSPDRALEIFQPLLTECHSQHTPGIILKEGPPVVPLLELALKKERYADFVRQMLALFSEKQQNEVTKQARPQAVRIPGTGETLSAREIEVLHLLVARASNREIANRLCISELTVKSHVNHILHKLDVTSRTKVAEKARELQMI